MINKFSWVFLLAGTIVMIYVMTITGKTLKTPDTPLGILNLEFSYNTAQVDKILVAWSVKKNNGSVIDNARRNTYFDFLFILFYSALLFISCKLLMNRIQANLKLKKACNIVSKAALAAGLLDIFENIGMLESMGGNVSGSIAIITTICAILKWILVIIVILFLFLAFCIYSSSHRYNILPAKKINKNLRY